MCGRTRFRMAPQRMAESCKEAYRLDLQTESVSEDAYYPSENCSPGARMGVLRLRDQDHESDEIKTTMILEGMRWGLVPSFTKAGEKPNFFRMFNARSETVPTKSIFSRLLKFNRCIVCIDGFYEWKDEHKGKQPYYIHFKDRPMLCAGLFDKWQEEGSDGPMKTHTILTTDATKRFSSLHDRMPVILPDHEACINWISGTDKNIQGVCKPYEGDDLVWHAVTRAMNKPSYKEDDCSKPLKQGNIASFFSPKKRPSNPGSKPAESDKRLKVEATDVKEDVQEDAKVGVKQDIKEEDKVNVKEDVKEEQS